MSDEAFTEMCNAFQRLIDAHCQSKSPFHNPVNADAMVALRALRSLRTKLAAAEARAERYRAALLACARKAEALKHDCSTDPESAQAIRNAQYQMISTTAHIALGTICGPDAVESAALAEGEAG